MFLVGAGRFSSEAALRILWPDARPASFFYVGSCSGLGVQTCACLLVPCGLARGVVGPSGRCQFYGPTPGPTFLLEVCVLAGSRWPSVSLVRVLPGSSANHFLDERPPRDSESYGRARPGTTANETLPFVMSKTCNVQRIWHLVVSLLPCLKLCGCSCFRNL